MLTSGALLQNRYRIIRQIGGGGQALVYLAEDANLGSLRAIKELTPDPSASPQERQAAYDQFQREARILAGLNHPNLARVWDHFRAGGNAYVVMDYIDGQTLQEIMDQSLRFLPETAVLRWAGQLCDVLDYLHRQHPPIIFRDLKPSNVMLDRSDTVKLIDFGIARHFKAGRTADTMSMGTPGYAPLEQHGQGQTDARSDIYALGATLYHLLTQHEPEPAPARVLPGQPDPLQPARVHNLRIKPATEAALTKAMAMDPNQRFQGALEMKRSLLEGVRRGLEQGAKPFFLIAAVALLMVVVWAAVRMVTSPGLTAWPRPTPMPTAAPTLTPEPPTPTNPTKAPPTAVPGEERVWEKDGSIMVHVPAGEFLMGSKGEPDAGDNEYPQHTVYVSEFWIDKTEVTNEQYHRCVAAGTCQASSYAGDERFNGANQPVVVVSWYDAQAYCEWAGKRLPTEAEWEKAARGTDGRKYPWGNNFDGSKVNFCDVNCGVDWKDSEANDGYQYTAPVGSYPEGASPYGALDMAGNVWEWCQDWYDEDYYASSPQHDPQGPSSGEHRVVRGGSWGHPEAGVRAALRRDGYDPDDRDNILGFRCVSQSPVGYDTSIPVTPSPTTTITAVQPTAVPTREQVWDKDGSVMVLVPAGEFLMGSKDDPDADDDELPQHTVYMSEFWIDKTEVTNEQYHRCVTAGDCQASSYAGDDHFNGADQPVVGVSWHDAKTYCEWAGKRLPTEAEWEKAARGTDGRKYPWGNSFDGSKVNFCDTNCELDWKDSEANDGYPYTAPVGSYPGGASPYGALDMAGNVREWCQDWYDGDYYANPPQRDPQGPSSGDTRVIRGGSWDFYESHMRADSRAGGVGPDVRSPTFGFRCVSQSP